MMDKKVSLKIQAEILISPQDMALALRQFIYNELGLYPTDLFIDSQGRINGSYDNADLVSLVKAAEYLAKK